MNDRSQILMCRPSHFAVEYVINPWMEGHVGRARREVAIQQWEVLHGIVGGLADVSEVEAVLERVDGAMIGRQAYQQPYFLAELERHFDPRFELPDRREIVERMLPYIESVLEAGEPLGRVTRHMLGLYAGQPGARAWRRHISENAHCEGAGVEVLRDALNAMPQAV